MQRIPGRLRPVVATAILGLAAVLFQLAINFVYHYGLEALTQYSRAKFLLGSFLLVAGTAAISGWLLTRFCPDAAGSGIPQLKLAFWRDFGVVARRVVWLKFLGGALSVGGGSSLGREGPSVQLAGGRLGRGLQHAPRRGNLRARGNHRRSQQPDARQRAAGRRAWRAGGARPARRPTGFYPAPPGRAALAWLCADPTGGGLGGLGGGLVPENLARPPPREPAPAPPAGLGAPQARRHRGVGHRRGCLPLHRPDWCGPPRLRRSF